MAENINRQLELKSLNADLQKDRETNTNDKKETVNSSVSIEPVELTDEETINNTTDNISPQQCPSCSIESCNEGTIFLHFRKYSQ